LPSKLVDQTGLTLDSTSRRDTKPKPMLGGWHKGFSEAITRPVITPYRKPDRNADLRSAEIQGARTQI